MILKNWGNYPQTDTTLHAPASVEEMTQEATRSSSALARGLGRCYGDSALNDTLVLSTEKLDKMLDFSPETGILTAEAGVSLADIVHCFLPRGWFVPVTPGTKFVTLGGAVASDVHGKNHHVSGTFGQHVAWLEILTAEHGVVRCSPKENSDLFYATCGGHGLTGIILKVALKLVRVPSAWIKQTSVRTTNLQEIMEAFEEYASMPYSVAWIDCLKKGSGLGRSILMGGDFATPDELSASQVRAPHTLKRPHTYTVPFDFPALALNPLSVRAFNALYYGKTPKGKSDAIVSYNTFFYPLDAVNAWNRIYGKRGFTQYQFVIPKEASTQGLPKILGKIAASGAGSFLAVLKLFGRQKEAPGNISFPMEGYTLALDFPVTSRLFPLLDELDSMVLDYGGRHYLTKDARMSAEVFHRGYGHKLNEFLAVKKKWDPANKFSSLQAKRLNLIQTA